MIEYIFHVIDLRGDDDNQYEMKQLFDHMKKNMNVKITK